MKKIAILVILFMAVSFPARASYNNGRTDKGYWGRLGVTQARGLLNLAGMPLELTSTTWEEMRRHHWLWPFSFLPRMFNNLAVRGASTANDLLLMPFVLPFTDDISPLTEPMGLPDYPWQTREASL